MDSQDKSYGQLVEVLKKINLYVEMIKLRMEMKTGSRKMPITLEGGKLRDYQVYGYQWITTLYENGMNGILADEMGLGKTVQVIAGLADLIESGVCGPFLVISPLSLLSGWADQLADFAPRLPCMIYYGSLKERLNLRKSIRRRIRVSLKDPIQANLCQNLSSKIQSSEFSTDPNLAETCNITNLSTTESHSALSDQSLTSSFNSTKSTNKCYSTVFSTSSCSSFDPTSKSVDVSYKKIHKRNTEASVEDTVLALHHVDTIISDVLNKLNDPNFKSFFHSMSKNNEQLISSEGKSQKRCLLKHNIQAEKLSTETLKLPKSKPMPELITTSNKLGVDLSKSSDEIDSYSIINNTQVSTALSPTKTFLKSKQSNIGDLKHQLVINKEMNNKNEVHLLVPLKTCSPIQISNELDKDNLKLTDEPFTNLSTISPGDPKCQTKNENKCSDTVIRQNNHLLLTVSENKEEISKVTTILNLSSNPEVEVDKSLRNSMDQNNKILPEYNSASKLTMSPVSLLHVDEVITDVLDNYHDVQAHDNHFEIPSNDIKSCSESVLVTEKEVDLSSECHSVNEASSNSKVSKHNRHKLHEDSSCSYFSKITDKENKDSDIFWTCPIVLTSFDVAMRDANYLRKIPFKALIVDEGQRLKNPLCRLYKRLAKFSAGLRILVTGTPLQNRLSELWSLLHFILPEIFTSLEMFEKWFNPVILSDINGQERLVTAELENSLVSKLHSIIRPFMLRRSKKEANLLLPPKREILLRANMTPIQAKLYHHAVNYFASTHNLELKENIFKTKSKNQGSLTWLDPANILPETVKTESKKKRKKDLSPPLTRCARKVKKNEQNSVFQNHLKVTDVSSEENEFTILPNISLNNGLMILRRIINHPYLAIERIIPDDDQQLISTTEESNAENIHTLTAYQKDLIEASGKTILLDRLLTILIQTGHKVIIFSQLTMILDLLEEHLEARQWAYVRLDGQTKLSDRQDAIKRFNFETVDKLPIFLISTRAGGCGLNLQTAADTVIIFDSDWNPQTDLQAQDRCHRIGQSKPVLVIRLVTSGTIDETIVQRAQNKRGLERLILSSKNKSLEALNHINKKEKNLTNNSSIKHNWVKQSKPFLNMNNTDMNCLSRTELLNLLKYTDFEKDITNTCALTDDELMNLLDRSDLLKSWEIQKQEGGHFTCSENISSNNISSNCNVNNECNNENVNKIDDTYNSPGRTRSAAKRSTLNFQAESENNLYFRENSPTKLKDEAHTYQEKYSNDKSDDQYVSTESCSCLPVEWTSFNKVEKIDGNVSRLTRSKMKRQESFILTSTRKSTETILESECDFTKPGFIQTQSNLISTSDGYDKQTTRKCLFQTSNQLESLKHFMTDLNEDTIQDTEP